ncbi:MAG TPA: hypothetical protein VGD45_20570 [Steroidobacter sp.]|uniref:hypothetical protein n=1 Tax=Steroidobacter sp. TaxID=1978227 RepID=UPI002ED855A9
MSRRSSKQAKPLTDIEREALTKAADDSEERRRRVVRAFLALREVKSIGIDPEPVFRRLRRHLERLPDLAAELEFEDAVTIERILELISWRILEDVEDVLRSLYVQPASPALARYVEADRELKQLDLADQ